MSEIRTIISNRNLTIKEYIKSIFLYKKILYSLIYRDFKSKYIQTKLGVFWTILQQIINISIYTFFFTNIIHIDTGETPYFLIALSGLLLWNFFSVSAVNSSTVLINSQSIIKNLNFPKIYLLLNKTILNLFDAFISLIIFFLALIYMDISITFHMILMPFLLLITMIFSLTISIWASLLSLRKRDILNFLPHIFTVGIWLTPVFYPSTIIPQKFEFIVYFNPIAGLIEWMRFIIFKISIPNPLYLLSFSITIILFITGLIKFKNIEGEISEII